MGIFDNLQDRFALTGLGGAMSVNPATSAGYEARALQGVTPDQLNQWGGAQDGVSGLLEQPQGRFTPPDAGAAYMNAYKSMMGSAQPGAVRFQDNTPRMLPRREPVQAMNPNPRAMSEQAKLAQILRGA